MLVDLPSSIDYAEDVCLLCGSRGNRLEQPLDAAVLAPHSERYTTAVANCCNPTKYDGVNYQIL